MSDDARIACRKQALRLLARREHSRRELERKLHVRSFDADLIAATLDELGQEKLLDAARFAESYVRMRSEKGYGPKRIRLELVERGIPGADACHALETAEIDWSEHACRVREKRFGPDLPAAFAERARQSKFLDYRGFESGQIAAALSARHETE